MDRTAYLHRLEGGLRAQVTLLQACARAAAAARDPRVKSAWIGAVVRLMSASAVTGSMIATIRWAPADSGVSALPVRPGAPKLPPLPNLEGPPPPNFYKTTSGGFSNRISRLAVPTARPRLRVKSKGGAPRGNRNAHKSGCHTAAFREFSRALALYARMLKAELAVLRAALPRVPARIVCEIVTPRRCYVRTRRGVGQSRGSRPAVSQPVLSACRSVKAVPERLWQSTSAFQRRRVCPRVRSINRRVDASAIRVCTAGSSHGTWNTNRATALPCRRTTFRSLRRYALRPRGMHAREPFPQSKVLRCPR
jgi:hypothetical protein